MGWIPLLLGEDGTYASGGGNKLDSEGFLWIRMMKGAYMKASFRVLKAWVASGGQDIYLENGG